MKRLSAGQSIQNIFGDCSDEEDDNDWSFSTDRGTGSRKRKSVGDKSWSSFHSKRQDFRWDGPSTPTIDKADNSRLPKNHIQTSNVIEIVEIQSPKRKNDDGLKQNSTISNSDPHPEQWTVFEDADDNPTQPKNHTHNSNVLEIAEFESPSKKNSNRHQLYNMVRNSDCYSEPWILVDNSITLPYSCSPEISSASTNITPTNVARTDYIQNSNIIEIGEFESPKKKNDDYNPNDTIHNSEAYSEQWTVVGGKRRKKRCLAEDYKAIVNLYDSSVRRFAQDYRLKKFDENLSMTLIVRYTFPREEKLIWTICRHIEDDVDRCVMFKPLYVHEIIVGVVLKLYQPWKEMCVPGRVPISVIVCTDFYRIGGKRENYFEVCEEMRNEIKSSPVSLNSNYIRVTVDDELSSLLSSLLPFQLRNLNTISKQTKSVVRPSVDLDAVIYQLSLSSLTSTTSNKLAKFLLCDSDNCFFILQLPEVHTEKIGRLLQTLESSQYISFKGLCIISRTTKLEDTRLFPIFNSAESNQQFYFTVGLRYCTTWETPSQLDIPCRRLYLTQEDMY